jgi:zinc protease
MAALNRKDLVTFHQTYFTPNNAFLVIVGDIREDEIEKEIRRLFKYWAHKPTPDQTSSLPRDIETRRIHVIDKPDISQTHVRIGILGVPRSHPDYIPLLIVNTILGGGGFTSRLMDRIRVNKGLTYSIASRFTGQRERGAFIVASFTNTETTGELIEAILEELRLLREEGVKGSEIRSAKQYLSGVFPLSIEGPGALANQLAGIELFGLPKNYIEIYRDQVKGVSEDEVSRVIQDHIPGDIWLAVVLGKADDIIPRIEHLGPIERHDFRTLDRKASP